MIRYLCTLLALVSVSTAQYVSPYVGPYESPYVSAFVGEDEGTRPFYGISFDGGDYIYTDGTVGTLFEFGLNSFTIECWVKFDSLTTSQFIYHQENGANSWSIDWSQIAGGEVNLYLDDRGSPGGGNAFSLGGASGFVAGQWHHVAAVVNRTNNTAYVYVDGVQRGSADITLLGTMTIPDTDILIGAKNRDSAFLNGYIADFAIHHTAVSDFSNRTTTYKTGTRVAAWAFQPGTGTSATPYVGSANWTFGAGAAAPDWPVSDVVLPPTRF